MHLLAAIDPATINTLNVTGTVLRVAFLVVVAWPLVFLFSRFITRITRQYISKQTGMLIRRSITYIGSLIIIIMILREFGFQLSTVLGAAGIVGIAVGFASQTSLSNLISGLFLIWEKPFQLGDLIKIGDTQGFVHSIDLLSVKMRTFDNQFVRIPNETILKGQTTNITYFPIRRMDIIIGVSYKQDLEKVLQVLKDLANENPHCLNEPEPLVVVKELADSSINFLLGMWFYKTDYTLLRNSFLVEMKKRFDEEGIEIPFPQRTLTTGSSSEPFPIKIVDPATMQGAQPDKSP